MLRSVHVAALCIGMMACTPGPTAPAGGESAQGGGGSDGGMAGAVGTGGTGGEPQTDGGSEFGGAGGGDLCAPGDEMDCYEGPPNTAGVGICTPGISTCDADGSAWGTCMGAVMPAAETCNTLEDDDCNGLPGGAEGGQSCICMASSVVGSCYSGPSLTEGVGLCFAGTLSCNEFGNGYQPCSGEVLPIAEDCATPGDDDCDGVPNQDCVCAAGDTQVCYAGLPSTLGVGPCTAGIRTCNSSGNGFGPCVGQVLPRPEACETAADDDCNGSPTPCTTDMPWSRHVGGTVEALMIDTDAAGNVLVLVRGTNNIDFGAGPQSGTLGLAKYGPLGNLIWSRFYVGNGLPAQATFDSDGGVVLAGSISGQQSLGGPIVGALGATNFFVVKLDAAGAFQWNVVFPSSVFNEAITALAVDSVGEIYVGGTISSVHDFGGGVLTPAMSSGDGFLLKLSSTGAHLWSQILGSSSGGGIGAVAVDPFDDVVVTGYFVGTLAFGSVPSNGSNFDIFVAKLGPLGNTIWSKGFGDSNYQTTSRIAIDASGNVGIVGQLGALGGSLDLGGGPMSALNGQDLFLGKLDVDGDHVFSRSLANGAVQTGQGVAFSDSGDMFVTGGFQNTVAFGASSLTSNGQQDVFLASYDGGGVNLSAQSWGEVNPQTGMRVAITWLGAPVLLGQFSGTLEFGQAPLSAAAPNQVFVAKLLPP